MKAVKIIFLTRTKWVLSLSTAIGVGLLLCYAGFAYARRSDAQPDNNGFASRVSSAVQPPDLLRRSLDNESDPEFVKLRREWLNRVLASGPLRVPTEAYLEAVAAASAIPLSPLIQSWTFPALSPMWNDYGTGGNPCQTPLPPNSPCGSSARIDAIAVDPLAANGDIVYVGSEGGLAKSTDGGGHWTYLSDSLRSQSIRSIAVDPVAPNIVYVGTGTNASFGRGLCRSGDSGATWTIDLGLSQFSGKTIRKIAIDPSTAGSQTSTTLYVSVTGSGNHSIWKSTNSGASWTQKRGPTANAGDEASSFYDMVIDPNSPSTLYVTAPDGVFKSTNGGTNWSPSIHPIPEASKPSYLVLVNVLGVPTLYLAFQECVSSHVTCSDVPSIAKSTDQGLGWTSLSFSEGQGDCCLSCFGVDPAHPDRIFAGGAGDLQYSTDSGNSWTSSRNVHIDMHAIAFCPTNSQRNYMGTDGGIYRADYGGSGEILWYSKNENLAGSLMYGVSISSDDHMVMGNQDNGTQLGWAGRNPPWQIVFGGDGWKPRIDQNDSNNLYYVDYVLGPVNGDNKAPERRINGVDANKTPPGAYGECSQFFPTMFVAPGDWSRVIMGFQNVWRSADSGETWTRIGGGTGATCTNGCVPGIDPSCRTITSVYEAPSNTDIIYAVADYAKVYVTSNAGQGNSATWSDRTNGTPGGGINAVTIHPTDPNTAYIACTSNVYKTTDMGATWTQRSPGSNLVYRDLAIDPGNPEQVFAASYFGVYSSTNGGTSWASMSAGIPAGMIVTSLSFNAMSRQLAASTYGRGAYILDLDDIPPTVSITYPPYGATLSGTVTITATASDNHLLAGVQFKVDGGNIGAQDTSPPYSIDWNTTLWTNGAHRLTAIARDVRGNTTTSANVRVNVSNP